jgi:hypothetical protein
MKILRRALCRQNRTATIIFKHRVGSGLVRLGDGLGTDNRAAPHPRKGTTVPALYLFTSGLASSETSKEELS